MAEKLAGVAERLAGVAERLVGEIGRLVDWQFYAGCGTLGYWFGLELAWSSLYYHLMQISAYWQVLSMVLNCIIFV